MSRTPEQIRDFVQKNQHKFDLPSMFYGTEPNTYQKPFDDAVVRWLVMASWPYEAAAGNQSIPSVYKAVNEAGPEHMADRWYLPDTPHDLRMFEREGYPVFGIESKRQLTDFDVVGTSISYPVLILNFYKYLSMSGLPLRWKQRVPEDHPMVIVGGQAYGSPEALAPVVDCFWLGEVEEEAGNPGMTAVTERIADFKKRGMWTTDRVRCYQMMAREFNFLYFPRFLDVQYHYEDRSHVQSEDAKQLSKQVCSYTSNIPGLKLPFTRRFVKDLNNITPLTAPPLLYADPGLGAGDLEVGRGCPAWCNFCALTYRQKPYRQRDVEYMVEFAKEFTMNMGGTHLAPFSPDFPMHTDRKRLIEGLLTVSDEVSASTMRVDDFIDDPECILLQAHGGLDAVTLGVEGNSQRMRDLVGKGCSDDDIKEAVARGIRAGVRKFKLYMISNLPGEDAGDIYRILKLAHDVADIRDNCNQPHVRIQFSWTPLLIEGNTPMQWFAVPTDSRVVGDVWEEFRDLQIDCKLGTKAEPNKAAFFQMCQRASREVGEAIVDYCEEVLPPMKGGCWGGVPKTAKVRLGELLVEHGFLNAYDDTFEERFKNDLFGNEFISQGISKEMMWRAYQQTREFAENTDSATYDQKLDSEYHGNEWIERCDSHCYGKTCGACDVDDLKIRRSYIRAGRQEYPIDLSALDIVDQKSQALKVRAKLVKDASLRFARNDHWRFAIRRAGNRAVKRLGFDFIITKRSLTFVSDQIKFKDWTAGVDYVEFGLTKRATHAEIDQFVAGMNVELNGIQLQDYAISLGSAPGMRTDIDLSLWELEINDELSMVLSKLAAWHKADYVKVILQQQGGYFAAEREEFNAKDFVDDIWLVREGHRVLLRMMVRGKPSPYNIYAAMMGKGSWIEAASNAAMRVEAFVPVEASQSDFFRVSCEECGRVVPHNVMDQPFDLRFCPHCKDRIEGTEVKAVSFV